MDHRQDYPERDELRAKFTRWLETIIKRAKIDYLRKYENRPEIISYEDIPEAELLDLAQCESWPKITRMQSPYDFEEERLTKAFMELPLKRRQVMELLFLEDLSEAETAQRLNCSLQFSHHLNIKEAKGCHIKHHSKRKAKHSGHRLQFVEFLPTRFMLERLYKEFGLGPIIKSKQLSSMNRISGQFTKTHMKRS